jgi:hypothetical protein
MTNLNTTRIDDNDVLFFANELNHYDPREFETIKSGLSFLDTFHCNTSIDRGQETYSFNVYEGAGEAKEITKNSKDIPFVTANGKQFTTKFVNIGSAIEYTTQDLLASNVAKKDILSKLRSQAMRANFELINKRCFFGNSQLGINGLFSDENITNKEKVAEVGGETTWDNKTAEEILKDIVDTHINCMEATNNLIRPDTLLISSMGYNQIATKIFNNFHGTTILKQVETMLRVKVKITPELNKAVDGESGCFVFFKNNSHYVEQLIPSFFHTEKPIRHMNGFEVGCFSRYGGLVIRQPKMFAIRYGI